MIEAPATVDGTAVLYRLAYADVQQLRPYAQARWSMPPAQLVRQRLRDQLSQQRVVLNPAEGPAGWILRLELEEFTQVFETPDRSVGLVRLRATLLETVNGRERLVAQRRFTVQRPAASADAPGGVRAARRHAHRPRAAPPTASRCMPSCSGCSGPCRCPSSRWWRRRSSSSC